MCVGMCKQLGVTEVLSGEMGVVKDEPGEEGTVRSCEASYPVFVLVGSL